MVHIGSYQNDGDGQRPAAERPRLLHFRRLEVIYDLTKGVPFIRWFAAAVSRRTRPRYTAAWAGWDGEGRTA